MFQAKDQARELKDRIRMIILNFQDYQLQQGPVLPFRLKLTPSNPDTGFYFRQRLDDLFYQSQVLNDIYIYYQYGTSRFDSASTELLQDYLDVAFLGLTRLALNKQSPDKGCFRIEAYQTGKGRVQIEHLLKSYHKLLDSIQIQHKLDLKQQQIDVEGYGIAELFRAEEGIHLFFIAQEAPLPLMSYWIPEGQKKQASPKHQTILRLYDEHRTITDLRSGFTNTYHMTPGEMKVLLFAGL
ncbi:hypothetical protein RZS08_08860, partial [Arthrospira platensis SPKY1]|nr:hypothetical protein [Arthrospira platensis SPKY1]